MADGTDYGWKRDVRFEINVTPMGDLPSVYTPAALGRMAAALINADRVVQVRMERGAIYVTLDRTLDGEPLELYRKAQERLRQIAAAAAKAGGAS